jgi:hypothetical protein
MPKASAPPVVGAIDLNDYAVTLEALDKLQIARTLGLASLPDDIAAALQQAISVYRATLAQPIETTPHASIAAISDVQRISKSLVKRLARFTNEGSGVDGETFDVMCPYATAIAAALAAFDLAAEEEKKGSKPIRESILTRNACDSFAPRCVGYSSTLPSQECARERQPGGI